MRRTARSSEARRSATGASVAERTPPQRTCVACRAVRAKRDLVRIVRSPSGEITVDARGKAPGRGAYCDPDEGCLDRGLREGAVARALEVTIDASTADRLRGQMEEVANMRRMEKR